MPNQELNKPNSEDKKKLFALFEELTNGKRTLWELLPELRSLAAAFPKDFFLSFVQSFIIYGKHFSKEEEPVIEENS